MMVQEAKGFALLHNFRFEVAMQTETPVCEDSTLAAVRRRSQGFLGYLFWVCVVLCLLWVADVVASLLGRWVTLLKGARSAVGWVAPLAGPD
jgi:CDP-diglyceride synthetase